jgi:uncharacterized protein YndB with AHSA1/START domain
MVVKGGSPVLANTDVEEAGGASERAQREIVVEASPEEVWEAIATEEGRGRWLGEDRDVHIETLDPPHRLSWWWAGVDEPATRVEFLIVAMPAGARVIVTETAPFLPLAMLAASFQLVLA